MQTLRFWLLTCLIAMATSCSFTEEIVVKEDGSGNISLEFDGSQFLTIMEDSGKANADEGFQDLDSIVSFANLLESRKDSISKLPLAEQQKLERLKPFKMHMVMNEAEKRMDFRMFGDFEQVSDLGNMLSDFQNANSVATAIAGTGAPTPGPAAESENLGTAVTYSFTGNTFRREGKIADREQFNTELEQLKLIETFMESATYTLKYHFPRPISSSSAKDATIDGKTLIYEVPFLEIAKNPEMFSFNVELEK